MTPFYLSSEEMCFNVPLLAKFGGKSLNRDQLILFWRWSVCWPVCVLSHVIMLRRSKSTPKQCWHPYKYTVNWLLFWHDGTFVYKVPLCLCWSWLMSFIQKWWSEVKDQPVSFLLQAYISLYIECHPDHCFNVISHAGIKCCDTLIKNMARQSLCDVWELNRIILVWKKIAVSLKWLTKQDHT